MSLQSITDRIELEIALRKARDTISPVILAEILQEILENAPVMDLSSVALRPFNEGAGEGFALKWRDPANYGTIGEASVDLTFSDVAGNYGAVGYASFAFGYLVEASGYGAIAFGVEVFCKGVSSFISGLNLKEAGYTNSVFGIGHDVTNMNCTVIGQASKVINENVLDFNAFPKKPLFVIGNGSIQNNDFLFTVLSRSDAFRVYYDGTVELSSTTNALIDADTSGKIAVTKEWVEANFAAKV
jgi:hypothetical protein